MRHWRSLIEIKPIIPHQNIAILVLVIIKIALAPLLSFLLLRLLPF